MSIESEKLILRKAVREKRVALAASLPDFAKRIAAVDLALPEGAIIAGYAALPGEADPHLLLKHLAEQGHAIAFPRVVTKTAPLSFHLWQEGMELKPGAFNVPEPSPDWMQVAPRVLLVPLLAFDFEGYRLGYGGGFYDRTLAQLRQKGEVLAIGIAFAGQEVDSVPHDENDRRLDMVLTENGLKRFE
jgi:5-formyltetrahydrofolate cyclo-ligase